MAIVSDPDDVPQPPKTGVPAIDEALAALDLSGEVSEHPQQFAQVTEVLQAALRDPGTT
jgi:hypothetical protein